MIIDFCGDSTMAGLTGQSGNYQTSPVNPPAVVQLLAGTRAICRNLGVGGSTSQDWHLGQGNVTTSWTTRVATTPASVLVINTGINDCFVPGLTPTAYTATIRELNRLALAAGKVLVYVTPNPINYPSHLSGLWSMQHAVKAAAPEINMPVIDVWGAIAASAGAAWPSLLPDTIHPSSDLYRLIGHVIYTGLAVTVLAAIVPE